MTNATPPRIAEAALRLILPPHDRDTVSGDLLEEYRESVYPQRGRVRADAWFVSQVIGFLCRDNRLWAALLGASLIARTALDWLVPTVDFQTRSTVSTVLAIGVLSFSGFSAAWRSGSPWTGVLAGITSAVIAAAISIAGASWLLIVYHDPATLVAIRGSGGLQETFTLPLLLVVPGACLGALGGTVSWVLREFVGAARSS